MNIDLKKRFSTTTIPRLTPGRIRSTTHQIADSSAAAGQSELRAERANSCLISVIVCFQRHLTSPESGATATVAQVPF